MVRSCCGGGGHGPHESRCHLSRRPQCGALALMKILSFLVLLLPLACAAPQRADDNTLTEDERALLASQGISAADLHCNSQRTWNPTLRAEAKAGAQAMLTDLTALGVTIPPGLNDASRKVLADALSWRMVRATIVDGNQNNLGVIEVKGVKTQDGKPLLLFRSGFTPRPGQADSCLASLLQAGVRHGVNLYQGPMPTADLAEAEAKAFTLAFGTYYNVQNDAELASWRDELRDDPAAVQKAMESVARVIRDVVLQRGERAPPQGHVALHCGGGMHRTGMVVGVLERCWNGAPQEVWERAYRRHVAWQSDAQPGGFEAANVAFIAGFDCSLLKNR